MTRYRIELVPQALDDLERLQDFLRDSGQSFDLLDFVSDALDVLSHQPGIGRPVEAGLRELIIERGGSGYLAQYRYLPGIQTVRVLRLRHQREAGYPLEDF